MNSGADTNMAVLQTLCLLVLFWGVNSAVVFNTNCQPRNCSQARRYYSDSYFPCNIGMKTEWDVFQQTNDVLESYEHNPNLPSHMNPPSLSATSLYLIPDGRDQSKTNPTLNLTFSLPKHNSYDTKALLIRFTSTDDDPQLSDPFYTNNVRFRLFNFPLYNTPEWDKTYPREINYRCFMGLDDCGERRVYLITMTAFTLNRQLPGSSITYHITTYNRRFATKSWELSIAVAFLPLERLLHVVFEPLPPEHVTRLSTYYVYILDVTTKIKIYFKIDHGAPSYEHYFDDIAERDYIVQVEARNCVGITPCPTSTSGVFTVKNLQADTGDTGIRTANVLPALLGVLCGVVLLLVLLVCFIKSNDYHPRVYILSLCHEDLHEGVAKALSACFQTEPNPTLLHGSDCVDGKWSGGIANKLGLKHQHLLVIAVRCHHVSVKDIENICQNWKKVQSSRKRSRGSADIKCVCFSQEMFDSRTIRCLDECFQWYDEPSKMIDYVNSQHKTRWCHDIIYGKCHAENVQGNERNAVNLNKCIGLTKPNICPTHSTPQDFQQLPQEEYSQMCPVHSNMHVAFYDDETSAPTHVEYVHDPPDCKESLLSTEAFNKLSDKMQQLSDDWV